jgi:hypothetical protein
MGGVTVGFTIFPCIVAQVHKNPSYIECTIYSRNISLIYAEPQHKLLFRVVRGGGGDF